MPDNSFSDLLSGYIYAMPPGVPDNQERLFLAGKIGGRLFIEKTKPVCPYTHTCMHTLSRSLSLSLSLSRARARARARSLMYTYVYLQLALTSVLG